VVEKSVVTVTYYAALADLTGRRSETLAVAGPTVGALRAAVAAAHPGAAELVRVSAVLDGDALLCNDEAGLGATVDLLPPFAGG